MKNIIKICVDFNRLENFTHGDSADKELHLNLSSLGVLTSLCHYKIQLKEGLILRLVDHDGMTVNLATIFFDKSKVLNNNTGWYAKFKNGDIWDDEPSEFDDKAHLCFNCRKDLTSHFKIVGQSYSGNCPFCETPIMFPMLPPT
jgi:hypothetical protein